MTRTIKSKELLIIPTPQHGTLKVEILKDRSKARAQFEWRLRDYGAGGKHNYNVKTWIDLISIWVDPHTNKCCKFHGVQPAGVLGDSLGKRLIHEGFVNIDSDLQLTTDKNRSVLRYGWQSKKLTGSYQTNDRASHDDVYIYDTKSIAIRRIIEATKKFFSLGGVDQVNFNAVSDQLLTDIGLMEVKDELRRGASMWMGNVDKIVSFAQHSSYRTTSDSVRTSNVESFLEILSRDIGKAA